MEYKVIKIEKTNDGIEAEIHFTDENGDVVDSRKFLYSVSLSKNELEEAIRGDAEGVVNDHDFRLANKDRDRLDKEIDVKVEGLKDSFGLEK
jgi:hypothetical protein